LLGRLLLGEKDSVDVGEDTACSDGDAAEEFVQFFVVADGQLDVAGSDAGALVVAGSVAGKLQNLGGKVLHHSSEVDGGTATNAGGIAALAQEPRDTANRELKTSAGRTRLRHANRLSFCAATFSFSRHNSNDRKGKPKSNLLSRKPRKKSKIPDR